jgi:hypothetical protein
MKRTVLKFLLLFLLTSAVSAQPITQWVKDIGTSDNEYPTQICSDNFGNSYVAGAYSKNLIICNDTLPDVIQPTSSNSTQNLFISKFDSTGNCIWTKTGISKVPMTSGGAIGPEITDIKYFEGNIYCTGVFTDIMIFDNDTLLNPACISYCTSSFIMKIDTTGVIIWSKCFQGSTSYSGVTALVPYNNGIFVSGSYQGTILIDTFQLNAPNPWTYNGYLLKLNSLGNCLWAKNTGNSYIGSSASDLVFDNNKNLYIVGSYGDSIVFPTITLNDSTPVWARSTFFAKYDTLGNFIWAKGGKASIRGLIYNPRLCFSNSGHIYFTGSFSDSVRFGSATDTTTSSFWYKDILVKLDSMGQFIWSKASGNRNSFNNFSSAIESNNSGFVLFSGFMNTVVVGNDTINSNSGLLDNLLTQYDNNGNVIWNKYFGGMSQEIPKDVNCNSAFVYMTGRTMSNYSIDAFNITNKGAGDIFIGRLKINSSLTNLFYNTTNYNLEYSIFPNPTNHNFNVSSNKIIEQVIITDLLGQIVYQLRLHESIMFLQLEKAGVYFVTIISGRQTSTKKLIVTE